MHRIFVIFICQCVISRSKLSQFDDQFFRLDFQSQDVDNIIL